MGRALGVDVGTRRVGLALSDPTRAVATPLRTLDVGDAAGEGWARSLARRIAEVARAESCDTVVLGLPRGMSGRDTDATRAARAVAAALQDAGCVVALWDERLSSVEAERVLLAAGARRQARRADRDRVAATLILQGWLDAGRASGPGVRR